MYKLFFVFEKGIQVGEMVARNEEDLASIQRITKILEDQGYVVAGTEDDDEDCS